MPGVPAVMGATFNVPRLAIRVDGQLELFEDQFLDWEWDLTDADYYLSEGEFSIHSAKGQAGEVDVTEKGNLEVVFAEQVQQQLALIYYETGWTMPALVNWLDRQIPHPDLTQTQATLFISKAVTALQEKRGLALDVLARRKFRLRDALARKIDEHRHNKSRLAFQQALFSTGPSEVIVSPEICFSYSLDSYAPNAYYEGQLKLKKHFFPRVGDLKPQGEEFECAVFLDQLEQIEFWVRNLDRRREQSFWLPTATDAFYPDFVAKLKDGRILVVEYKGEHLWSNDDSREKRTIGELWEERSTGTCLFVMPKGKDWQAILNKISQ